jgi:hypothetical protein
MLEQNEQGVVTRVLNWIDRHVAIFVILGLLGLTYLGLGLHEEGHRGNQLAQRTAKLTQRLHRDEQETKRKAQHTAAVQVAGGPVAVCLLDALRAVTPLLERVPMVDKPLEAYVRLQSVRYVGVACPEK